MKRITITIVMLLNLGAMCEAEDVEKLMKICYEAGHDQGAFYCRDFKYEFCRLTCRLGANDRQNHEYTNSVSDYAYKIGQPLTKALQDYKLGETVMPDPSPEQGQLEKEIKMASGLTNKDLCIAFLSPPDWTESYNAVLAKEVGKQKLDCETIYRRHKIDQDMAKAEERRLSEEKKLQKEADEKRNQETTEKIRLLEEQQRLIRRQQDMETSMFLLQLGSQLREPQPYIAPVAPLPSVQCNTWRDMFGNLRITCW